jgi:hypothetical protein
MATLDEVREMCLNVMNTGLNVTDDLLETVNRIGPLFDDETIGKFNAFSNDDKLKVIIEFFKKPDLNWGRVGLLICLGKQNPHLAPFIANHIAQWIYTNGGFDKMIDVFAQRHRPHNHLTVLQNVVTELLTELSRVLFS